MRERERERERDARKDRCLSTKLSQRLCRHHAVHLLDRCRRSLPLADPHLAEPSCADLAKESNIFRIDGPVRSSCFFEELWYLDCILGVHWKQHGELCGFTKTIDDQSTIQVEGTLVSWSIDASEIERSTFLFEVSSHHEASPELIGNLTRAHIKHQREREALFKLASPNDWEAKSISWSMERTPSNARGMKTK